jgi:hypothetical protein
VIFLRIDKDLRLVLEPPERLRMQHAVAVALKCGSDGIRLFGTKPAPTMRGLLRERRKKLRLPRLVFQSKPVKTLIRIAWLHEKRIPSRPVSPSNPHCFTNNLTLAIRLPHQKT